MHVLCHTSMPLFKANETDRSHTSRVLYINEVIKAPDFFHISRRMFIKNNRIRQSSLKPFSFTVERANVRRPTVRNGDSFSFRFFYFPPTGGQHSVGSIGKRDESVCPDETGLLVPGRPTTTSISNPGTDARDKLVVLSRV